MKAFKLKYYILLFLSSITHLCFSTHIAGGDITIKQLVKDNDQFEITLTLLFDDVNGHPLALSSHMPVYVYTLHDNSPVDKMTLYVDDKDSYIEYSNSNCVNSNINLSTRIIIYKKTVTFSKEKYSNPVYFSSQECCRNSSITNIKRPDETGFIFYAEFPAIRSGNTIFNNSSPVFLNLKGDHGCIGYETELDFSAVDTDGDDLRYELVEPFSTVISSPHRPAPYSTIDWADGCGINNLFNTGSISIDQYTGKVRIMSNFKGLVVISVKCLEYRNGSKIGETRRDYQVLFTTCPMLSKPSIAISTLHISQTDHNGIIQIKDPNEFIESISIDSQQILRVTYQPLNFEATKIRISGDQGFVQGRDTLKTHFHLRNCSFTDTSKIYEMNAIVSNSSCPQPLQDTLLIKFKVSFPINQKPISLLQPPIHHHDVLLQADQEYNFNIMSFHTDSNQITLQSLKSIAMVNGDTNISKYGFTKDFSNTPSRISAKFVFRPVCELLGIFTNLHFEYIVNEYCDGLLSDTVRIHYQISDNAYNSDSLKLPNIFTPNQDGINDVFYVKGLPPDRCNDAFEEAVIYNRWGNKIFESKDRNINWNGENSEAGTYFYEVLYQKHTYKGIIELRR